MICLNKNKQGTETLLDYCAGTLGPERAAAVENHARDCAACRTLIAEQKNLWSALDEMEAPQISEDFDARLYARIAAEETRPAWRAWWSRISALDGLSYGGYAWTPVLAGAAAATVLAVSLMVNTPLFHPHAVPDVSKQIVRPDSVDVEQLDVTLQDLEMLTPPSASAENRPASAGKSGKM